MDFTLPEHLPPLLAEMDAFIEAEIKPLEAENMQYFDRRREFARTDLDNGGVPRREWEDLLDEMRRRADKAGWLRYGLPSKFGGRDGSNLDMAVIREHLAHKGLGLHNDLQDESSIVGNFPQVIMMDRFGTEAGKQLIISEFERLRPASKGLLSVAAVHSWTTDPFSAGDWAIFQPGQVRELRAAIATPHQRLFFCGEHTAIGSRGMEGALESAERVSLEVLAAMA